MMPTCDNNKQNLLIDVKIKCEQSDTNETATSVQERYKQIFERMEYSFEEKIEVGILLTSHFF